MRACTNTKWLFRAQALCECRGGRPGLQFLISLMVSVDVKGLKHHERSKWPFLKIYTNTGNMEITMFCTNLRNRRRQARTIIRSILDKNSVLTTTYNTYPNYNFALSLDRQRLERLRLVRAVNFI